MSSETKHPVIDLMQQQKLSQCKGATMRLGAEDCCLNKDSLIAKVYNSNSISERHRHRYEFNSQYADEFERKGMRLVGHHPVSNLIEAIEIPTHPWFIGVQFHPEFKSKPHQPHPLFKEFIGACLKNSKNT